MTQALAAYQAGAWEPDGTEEVRPSFPRVSMVQAMSSGGDQHAGAFYRSDTEAFYDSLDIVPLAMKWRRAMFVDGEDRPVCSSPDGVRPFPDQPAWEGGLQPDRCEGCRFARPAAKGEGSPCKASIVVLADHEGELVQVQVKGMSIGPWMDYVRRRVKAKNLPLCSQRMTLTTEFQTDGPKKKWHELRIAGDLLPANIAEQYNALIRTERERFHADGGEPESEPESTFDVSAEEAAEAGGEPHLLAEQWGLLGQQMKAEGLKATDVALVLGKFNIDAFEMWLEMDGSHHIGKLLAETHEKRETAGVR
jgi:hypothetical protein